MSQRSGADRSLAVVVNVVLHKSIPGAYYQVQGAVIGDRGIHASSIPGSRS